MANYFVKFTFSLYVTSENNLHTPTIMSITVSATIVMIFITHLHFMIMYLSFKLKVVGFFFSKPIKVHQLGYNSVSFWDRDMWSWWSLTYRNYFTNILKKFYYVLSLSFILNKIKKSWKVFLRVTKTEILSNDECDIKSIPYGYH